MADGQVVFEISADGKKAYASLNDFTRAVDQAGKKWDQSVSGSADNMQKSFSKAFDIERLKNFGLEIGKALIQFGKEAVDAASDLREVQNVVDVTFGESAGQINEWAQTAIKQFGLTETKAKQFTSTLGAMMKSAGLAGPEIVTMSEDLAGLAADMSSFYNLDFDTAFQKIRSGISGETEPLKQLGINMSVANLNAFALEKGLTTTFEKMSQGEQISLRYQYLMKATADAQGDFARTSDGYANSLRLLGSNIESIKTKLGTILIPALENATGWLNSTIEALTPTESRTVLDDFADIDLKTGEKLAQIRTTAAEAQELVGVLGSIAGTVVETPQSSGLVSFVESFAGKLNGLDDAMAKAKTGNYEGTIKSLASALSTELGGDPVKWETMLTAIGDKLPGATTAAMNDEQKTAVWMNAAADAAKSLGGDYSGLWSSLLTALGDNAGAVVSAFASAAGTGDNIKAIAEGVNVLKADQPSTWRRLLTALQQVDGLSNVFSNANAGKNVESLARALSGASPDTTKAEAWNTFLSALQDNAGALTALTGKSAEETSAWLSSMAEAANKLDPYDARAWNELLSNFVGGLPGLQDTEGGKAFFSAMATNFLALGNQSEHAKKGLAALGWSTDQISAKQAEWLEVCKRLVQTIPGLNEIIDTQTGEVRGGVGAVNEYVTAWKNAQELMTLIQAQEARRRAVQEKYAEIPGLEIDLRVAENRLKEQKAKLDALKEKYGFSGDGYKPIIKLNAAGRVMPLTAEEQAYNDEIIKLGELTKAEGEARAEYEKQTEAYRAAMEVIAEGDKVIQEAKDGQSELSKKITETGEAATTAAKETSQAMTDIELAASKSADGHAEALARVKTAVENAKDAYKELADYIEKTRSGIDSTVSGMFGIFNKIETPMQKAINNTKNLTNELNKGIITQEEYNKKISGDSDSYITSSKIIEGLKSQIDYMEEYQRMLDEAKKNGLSDELASALSDGSMESFDTLKALTAKGANIEEINKLYSQVQKQKSGFVDALTQQKLKADEVFDAIVAKAQEATAGLDQSGAAEAALANTVQGMVDGIAEKIPDLRSKVEEIGELLNTLSKYGMSFAGLNLGTIGGSGGINLNFSGGGNGSSNVSIAQKEIGMDRVPFDGYLASLHEGESILTAEEARVWRNMKYGPSLAGNQFDYGAMGSAIGANMPNFNGMQVVWNGQVLGRVIAAQQADSLRTMERSGWRG